MQWTHYHVNDIIDTMAIWLPSLSGRSGPIYLAIADAMEQDIAAGRLGPGERLPPQRDLAWRLNVTVGTIARAYTEAERRGLVSGEVGRGTYVSAPEDKRVGLFPEEQDWRKAARTSIIDLAINQPSVTRTTAMVAPRLRALADSPQLPHLLGYEFYAGSPRHRAAGVAWVAGEGIVARPEQMLVTTGGQQAIFAVLGALSRPGDTIFSEELIYPGLKRAAAMLGRAVDGIAMDGEGMIPEALEQGLAKRPGSIVYCVPTNQNPTVVTMSHERRTAIAAIVARHDGILVEDGIYSFLADNPPPPLWTYAPERAVYITSLSKIGLPGLRVGFAVVPERSRTDVEIVISATTLMVSPILGEIASLLIEDGSAFAAAKSQQDEARARMAIARAILGADVCPSGPAMNLWIKPALPWRTDAFVAELNRRGVAVSPIGSFAIGRRVAEAEGVRVSISAPRDHDELRRGLEIIKSVLNSEPGSGGAPV
jgi:DNA-binding transcriptional MocR family regulator